MPGLLVAILLAAPPARVCLRNDLPQNPSQTSELQRLSELTLAYVQGLEVSVGEQDCDFLLTYGWDDPARPSRVFVSLTDLHRGEAILEPVVAVYEPKKVGEVLRTVALKLKIILNEHLRQSSPPAAKQPEPVAVEGTATPEPRTTTSRMIALAYGVGGYVLSEERALYRGGAKGLWEVDAWDFGAAVDVQNSVRVGDPIYVVRSQSMRLLASVGRRLVGGRHWRLQVELAAGAAFFRLQVTDRILAERRQRMRVAPLLAPAVSLRLAYGPLIFHAAVGADLLLNQHDILAAGQQRYSTGRLALRSELGLGYAW